MFLKIMTCKVSLVKENSSEHLTSEQVKKLLPTLWPEGGNIHNLQHSGDT